MKCTMQNAKRQFNDLTSALFIVYGTVVVVAAILWLLLLLSLMGKLLFTTSSMHRRTQMELGFCFFLIFRYTITRYILQPNKRCDNEYPI